MKLLSCVSNTMAKGRNAVVSLGRIKKPVLGSCHASQARLARLTEKVVKIENARATSAGSMRSERSEARELKRFKKYKKEIVRAGDALNRHGSSALVIASKSTNQAELVAAHGVYKTGKCDGEATQLGTALAALQARQNRFDGLLRRIESLEKKSDEECSFESPYKLTRFGLGYEKVKNTPVSLAR